MTDNALHKLPTFVPIAEAYAARRFAPYMAEADGHDPVVLLRWLYDPSFAAPGTALLAGRSIRAQVRLLIRLTEAGALPTYHSPSVLPSQKMDTPTGLHHGACSCGWESDGLETERGARRSALAHADARNLLDDVAAMTAALLAAD